MFLYFYMQVGNFQAALLGNFQPVLTPRSIHTTVISCRSLYLLMVRSYCQVNEKFIMAHRSRI